MLRVFPFTDVFVFYFLSDINLNTSVEKWFLFKIQRKDFTNRISLSFAFPLSLGRFLLYCHTQVRFRKHCLCCLYFKVINQNTA